MGSFPPTMKLQPASSTSLRLASLIIPASATTVTSAMPWASTNLWMTGIVVRVSARLPSNASIINGAPLASVSNPTVICGSRRRSFENPGSLNPSPVSVSNHSAVTS
jgi:hypothetical protein